MCKFSSHSVFVYRANIHTNTPTYIHNYTYASWQSDRRVALLRRWRG